MSGPPAPPNPNNNTPNGGDKGIKKGADGTPQSGAPQLLGVDFLPRAPPIRDKLPGELIISLAGKKGRKLYTTDLILKGPQSKVFSIKSQLAENYGYEFDSLRIICDGIVLRNGQTMAELEVQDYDTFEVFLEQIDGLVNKEPGVTIKNPQDTHSLDKEGEPDHEGVPKDVKPTIVGLEKPGADFKPLTQLHATRTRPPGTIEVMFLGTKDGTSYRHGFWLSPQRSIQSVKDLLSKTFGYDVGTLRLLYDGVIAQNDQTLAELEVEDNDSFDVYFEQIGGSACG